MSATDLPPGLTIEAAGAATPTLVEALQSLLPQLTDHPWPLDRERLTRLLASPGLTLLVARDRDGRIVGTASLFLLDKLSGTEGRIEDVVVDAAARGQGVGAALTLEAVRRAAALGAREVNLTSSPRREAANRLYPRLGFERRETNVYQYVVRR